MDEWQSFRLFKIRDSVTIYGNDYPHPLANPDRHKRSKTMKRIHAYSSRGQGVLLVLYALRDLAGACSKREVLRFIQNADFYEITRHDLPPYENQHEPRYHTLLAWARKDALIANWLIETTERDSWQLSRDGHALLEKVIERFRSGQLSVCKCYLWTPRFKKVVDPKYEPSRCDSIRPEDAMLKLLNLSI